MRSLADGAAIDSELPGVNVTLNSNGAGVFDQVVSSCKAGWCFAFGTSMASAAAAGIAALILGQNPGMSLGALKTALKNSADDEGEVGHDESYDHGSVNAAHSCGVN